MATILEKQYRLFFGKDDILLDFVLQQHILVYTRLDSFPLLSVSLQDMIWTYDENNIRRPFIHQELVPYYRLQDGDHLVDFISCHSWMDDHQVITGEKIQYLAEVVVGTAQTLQYNPNNPLFSKEMRDLNQLDSIASFRTLFVFTHDLDAFYRKFQDSTQDKIILTHNSDNEITQLYNFQWHFCQNVCGLFPRQTPIPIGIENRQWFAHGDYRYFYEIKNQNIPKTKHIYFYFNIATHPSRLTCFEKLKDRLEWNNPRPKPEYFKELSKHRFAICPRGNGLDTHRLWECFYLNTIPIVLCADFIHLPNLPMIVLDCWEDLQIEPGNQPCFSNQQLSKMTMDYYEKLIMKIP